MTDASQLRSGKGSRDENFPVASWLIKRKHRPVILAFYEFVRVADDIADHASLSAGEKLVRLDALERSLLGDSTDEPVGVTLAETLQQRGLTTKHAQDLLNAFRRDVTKLRYANWAELMDYCSLSAMPVGRFVLDVHGESRETWPANDALCAALQIINHLQDCAKDYGDLDRVYVPLDAMAATGTSVDALAAPQASPALLNCLHAVAGRTAGLLQQSAPFSASINDTGLALEVAAIQALALRLVAVLRTSDPLSQRVHLRKPAALATAARGGSRELWHRLLRAAPTRRYQTP
jgi:squalene synthase HpnC